MNPFHQTKKPAGLHPGRVICASFLIIILVGTLLLCLPFSSRSGQFTPLADCLFTATSATCVTGLVVYDTFSHWSALGQGIILALIQVGGLGLVTFTTFFHLIMGRKLGLRGMSLAQESGSFESLGDVSGLIRFVVKLSLSIELCGAVLLALVFVPRYGPAHGIGLSVFLAISAFCNAGFDTLGFQAPYASLTGFAGQPAVLLIISALIVLGGIGFLVIYDLMQYRKTRTLMLNTRIVLIFTLLLIALGFVAFVLLEWNNPATLGSLPVDSRLSNALFQSITLRTAGFNSIDLAALNGPTKFISILLMFVGAAPGSTGGGIKITTIAVLVMTVQSVIRGHTDTIILGRRVSHQTVYKAMAVFAVGLLIVAVCTACIFFRMQDLDLGVNSLDVLFEEVSAFATVGLSVGVTALADPLSRLLLIASMFLGRVGPVSLALSLSMRSDANPNKIIPDGKMIVG